MNDNILLMTDSYKVSHWKQYPAGTTSIQSFLEARVGGEFPTVTFFGLSYIIQRYLAGAVVTREKIEEAAGFFKAHFGSEELFNRAGWEIILDEYGGRLPLQINAVPEGTTWPEGTVLMTIRNTDYRFPWLVNYVETLLMQVWYPTTVATQSRAMKQDILASLEATGDPAGIMFKLHDFGYRGSTSVESAGIGGCAHLVNFLGTDTMAALTVARDFYDEPMAGYSIPASEHSTITAWGQANEVAAFENMLDKYPTGLVACVSDSYDIFHAASVLWGDTLRDKILKRDGTLVIRPDSGDPTLVLPQLLNILGGRFGFTMNEKGYKVLPPQVRVIQGDGIDRSMLNRILDTLRIYGWSTDNIAFGSGGGLLQKLNRDTCRFAIKACAMRIGIDDWIPVSKNPVTDTTKKSKAGWQSPPFSEMVFRDGAQFNKPTLPQVRERAGRTDWVMDASQS